MSVLFRVGCVCTGLCLLWNVILCIFYAWNYSSIEMTLLFDFDKKIVRQCKFLINAIKLTAYFTIFFLLLTIIMYLNL